jgi:shikimate dehydrogenase
MKDKYFLFGSDVSKSLSKDIFDEWFTRYNLQNVSYNLKSLNEKDFIKILKDPALYQIKGFNITFPYKEIAFANIENLDESAKKIGAVNLVEIDNNGKITGYNSDLDGFMFHVEQVLGNSFLYNKKRAMIIGSGGAARAVIAAMMELGFKEIFVTNRTKDNAIKIINYISDEIKIIDWKERNNYIEVMDVIVNATNIGMLDSDPDLLNYDILNKNQYIFDIVYLKNSFTKLVKESTKRGIKSFDGRGMLINQAKIAFETWFKIMPK